MYLIIEDIHDVNRMFSFTDAGLMITPTPDLPTTRYMNFYFVLIFLEKSMKKRVTPRIRCSSPTQLLIRHSRLIYSRADMIPSFPEVMVVREKLGHYFITKFILPRRCV